MTIYRADQTAQLHAQGKWIKLNWLKTNRDFEMYLRQVSKLRIS